MKKKMNEIKLKMNALDGINPQIGLALLRIGIVPDLILVSQVTPPELTLESLTEHDKNIINTAFKFLNPADRANPPKYSSSRKNRAIDILRLPIRHNGAGLTESALIAPIAFYASVAASCTVDPDLKFFQKGLNRFCESTHSLIIERIGPPSPETIKLETIFPRYDIYALLDHTFYVEIYNNNPSLKLQKELSKIAHDIKAKNLKDACIKETKEINQSDVVARHTLSKSSILFRAKLSKKNNRMNREDFVAWTRFHLGIPQLGRLGNSKTSPELGYSAEECLHPHLSGHYKLLDLHGNHANSGCPSAVSARSQRHSFLKWTISQAAQEAGCIVKNEPQTHNLLQQQFSPEECRALFPKTPSKEVIKEISDIKNELAIIERLPPGPERMNRRLDISNICKMMHKHHKTKGLRIDLEIIDPYTNEVRWIDATCIHPTCKSRIKSEISD